MNWEDAAPKKKAAFEVGEDLSTLSVKELEDCLAVLAAERQRIEALLVAKKASQDAAQSVFKN